jgi:hypothetical protein
VSSGPVEISSVSTIAAAQPPAADSETTQAATEGLAQADGLVIRAVFPVILPRVEYELTDLGQSLGAAFCGVWIWAEQHREAIMKAREAFRSRSTHPAA